MPRFRSSHHVETADNKPTRQRRASASMTEKVELSGNMEVPEDSVIKSGNMTFTLSNVAMRDWFHKTRESVKPWSEFVSTARFKLPKQIAPLGKRVVKNVEHFQGNYLFVFLGLVIFCVLTSPLLLIAIGACLGACYIISLKNQDHKYKIMGHEISLAQQYTAVGVLSFPLFWVAGAGSVVFWIIGASFFVIMLHASMYSIEEENGFAELTVEEV